jgi:hypothetical protein
MIRVLVIVLFLSAFSWVNHAQTTLEEIVGDMTLPHEGLPHGVPESYDWQAGPRKGAVEPPEGWTAVIAWGQLYEWAERNPATNTRVQIKDLEMYYLSKADSKWHLLQKSVKVDGNAYVEDFVDDINKPADKRNESDGSISVTCGGGFNFHFWPSPGRVQFPANEVAGCFVTVKARLIVDDALKPDDRDQARFVISVGGDWWESLTAQWDQWKTNRDMGIGRFRFVTSEWKSFNMFSVPIDTIMNNPPPYAGQTTSVRQIPRENNDDLRIELFYPRTYHATAGIIIYLPADEPVNLSVYDVTGRKIQTLAEGRLKAGEHRFSWDASPFRPGIYIMQLRDSRQNITQKCRVAP